MTVHPPKDTCITEGISSSLPSFTTYPREDSNFSSGCTNTASRRRKAFLERRFVCKYCDVDLTYRDVCLLLPCIICAVAFIICFASSLASNLINHKYPPSMPLFWSLLSCHFAASSGVLIIMYHTDEIMKKGLPMPTIESLNIFKAFTSLVGVILFLIVCISGIVFMMDCKSINSCETGSLLVNTLWFIAVLVWVVVLVCLSPKQSYLNKLSYIYEERLNAQRSRINLSTNTNNTVDGIYSFNMNNIYSSNNNGISAYPSPYLYGNPTN